MVVQTHRQHATQESARLEISAVAEGSEAAAPEEAAEVMTANPFMIAWTWVRAETGRVLCAYDWHRWRLQSTHIIGVPILRAYGCEREGCTAVKHVKPEFAK